MTTSPLGIWCLWWINQQGIYPFHMRRWVRGQTTFSQQSPVVGAASASDWTTGLSRAGAIDPVLQGAEAPALALLVSATPGQQPIAAGASDCAA